MSFCFKCGKNEIEETLDTFDTTTGEKGKRLICPDACNHGWHRDELIKDGFFLAVYKCQRCQRTYRAS